MPSGPDPNPARRGEPSLKGAGQRGGGGPWPGLSEADESELLGLVEGSLSPERERAVLTRWQGRPDILRMIEGMVGDRAGLTSVADAVPPRGLLNGVEAYLEREALLSGDEAGSQFSTGVEQGTLVSDRPPQVRVVPRRGGASLIFGRYGALAAVLAVAIGGAAYIMMPARTNTSTPLFAQRDAASSPFSDSSSGRISPAAPVDNMFRKESAGHREADGELAVAPSAKSSAPEAPGPANRGDAVPNATVAAAPAEISAERALELAREGRLMVRVVAGSAQRAMQKAQTALRDRDSAAGLVGSVDASPQDAARIASAAESLRPLHRLGADSIERGRPEALAASDKPPPARSVQASESVLDQRSVPRRTVASVDVRLSAEAIESLRNVLTTRGAGTVEFIELPEAIPAAPEFDAEQALWWTQPPSAWTPRVRVPVVFEQP